MIKTTSAGNFLISGNFGGEACWNLTSRQTRKEVRQGVGMGLTENDQNAVQGLGFLARQNSAGILPP